MSNLEIKRFTLNVEQNHLIKNELKERWKQIENIPGAFTYKLNVEKEKHLPGYYKFFCQFNAERTTLRRKPQSIHSLLPKFDENKFNFNKIKEEEKIIELEFEDSIITLLINNSPLTLYHSLICPQIKSNLPQILTKNSIKFSIEFLRILDDYNFRIGYNSAGALASVNHLHLHLIYLEHNLYIESIELEPIDKTANIWKISEKYPIKALCFIDDGNPDKMKNNLNKLYKLTRNLCRAGIPHNLFFTYDRKTENKKSIKIFLFAREKHCIVKDFSSLNIAFCELCGYVPVGDENLFNKINEAFIIEAIVQEIGQVFDRVLELLKSNL